MNRRLAAVTLLAALWPSAAGAATFHVDQQHPQASDFNAGTADAPWRTISRAAARLQPGDTVVIHAGTYREHVRPARGGEAGRPITYQAADGEQVVITGADVVKGWQQVGGGVWSAGGWDHKFPTHPDDEYHKLIGRCEQVIVDGKLLRQVATAAELQPGTFCADPENRTLYIRLVGDSDPNGHTVEASVRDTCFGIPHGGDPVDHVVVRGLTIRFAANMAQRGALAVRGSHWLVEDCAVEWTNGTGVYFEGDDVTFRRVRSSYNGQQGLAGSGHRFTLEDVAVDHNNQKGFDQGWEAGGFKITAASGGTVLRCQAVGNVGNGLWFDIDVQDVLVEQCLARDNAGHGIFVEISSGFRIRDNLCVGNGRGAGWGNGGIAVGEGRDCVIENNTCALNPTGITLREQGPRTFEGLGGQEVTYHVEKILVRRNVCAFNKEYQFGLWSDNIFFGPHPDGDSQKTPYDPEECDIRLDHNLYWAGGGGKLVLWGVPWRNKSEEYNGLAAWQLKRRRDAGSATADPLFTNPRGGDWTFAPRSPARELQAGARPARFGATPPRLGEQSTP